LKKLRWSMAAADDLEGIANYLYLHHSAFAASTPQRLYDAAKSLKAFPLSGRAGMKSGTRELVLAPRCHESEVRCIISEVQPQILRLHLAQKARQTTLRMTAFLERTLDSPH
jgi:plasmid stabilization system protein ParE